LESYTARANALEAKEKELEERERQLAAQSSQSSHSMAFGHGGGGEDARQRIAQLELELDTLRTQVLVGDPAASAMHPLYGSDAVAQQELAGLRVDLRKKDEQIAALTRALEAVSRENGDLRSRMPVDHVDVDRTLSPSSDGPTAKRKKA
jgi:hypothetical protein